MKRLFNFLTGGYTNDLEYQLSLYIDKVTELYGEIDKRDKKIIDLQNQVQKLTIKCSILSQKL
jgi:hypothetical protein